MKLVDPSVDIVSMLSLAALVSICVSVVLFTVVLLASMASPIAALSFIVGTVLFVALLALRHWMLNGD